MSAVAARPGRSRGDLGLHRTPIRRRQSDQADAFVDLVDSKFQVLSHGPSLGRRRPELSSDIRSLAIGRYVVFYRPLSRGIEVIRVLHGSRDIESIFENEQ